MGQSFRAPETIYNKLNDADIDFGTMKDPHGNTIPLSKEKIYQLYQSPDRAIRKTAAEKFSAAYAKSQYAFAEALQQHVHPQNTLAHVRHYPSARAMDLTEEFIPESVFICIPKYVIRVLTNQIKRRTEEGRKKRSACGQSAEARQWHFALLKLLLQLQEFTFKDTAGRNATGLLRNPCTNLAITRA